MSRVKWKGYFLENFLKKKKFFSNYKRINIWSRRSVIPSFLINKTVFVYNGKIFKKVIITREKIGLKFGEFVYTRIKPKHKKTKKK